MVLLPRKPSPPPASSSDRSLGVGVLVEYEQHGKAILGVVTAEGRQRWSILNEAGGELELPSDRLFIVPQSKDKVPATRDARVSFLKTLSRGAENLAQNISLQELWEITDGQSTGSGFQDLVEILFSKPGPQEVLAARRALARDQVYFKRTKVGFERRPAEVVEELERKAKAEAEKQAERQTLRDELVSAANAKDGRSVNGVEPLIDIAVHGKDSAHTKEWEPFLEEVAPLLGASSGGRPEDKAFAVLKAARVISPYEDLTLLASGRPRTFTPEALQNLATLRDEWERQIQPGQHARAAVSAPLIVTIDSATTRDIDDALSLERSGSGYRLGVHISDVASMLQPGSTLWHEAFRRGISVYTPDYRLAMLPAELSEDCLSLITSQPRYALSFMFDLDDAFAIQRAWIERTVLQVTHRMSYEEVDHILCDDNSSTSASPELGEMLHLLWNIASAYEEKRLAAGALQFNRKEAMAVVNDDGTVSLVDAFEDTPSHKLVSELMVLANEQAALFAAQHNVALVFRSQEGPDVDPSAQGLDIPEGPARNFFQRGFMKRSVTSTRALSHSGLGVEAYAQTTSPIRRMVDLLNQHQLVAYLDTGAPRWKEDELDALYQQLCPQLEEAQTIQRGRERFWLLEYLLRERPSLLEGTIVRVDGPRPLIELDLLGIIHPFTPLGGIEPLRNDPSGARKLLGKRTKVKIGAVSPRHDQLSLIEI